MTAEPFKPMFSSGARTIRSMDLTAYAEQWVKDEIENHKENIRRLEDENRRLRAQHSQCIEDERTRKFEWLVHDLIELYRENGDLDSVTLTYPPAPISG